MHANGLSDQKIGDNVEKNVEIKSEGLPSMEANLPNKIPYPKQVFLILGSEFCERFMYYGMNTILVLYVKHKLNYTENDATIVFHVFTMLVYLMAVFGGILSDTWLGKYKTILYLSIVYAIGGIVVSISATPIAVNNIDWVLFIGLLLISIGSGGIKPCVSAFAGDQFKLPEQAAQVTTFFSVFYLSINLGSLSSTALTPILRGQVHCFDQNDCYPLAFGLPAVLMIIATVLFVIGRSSYVTEETSSENIISQVSKCIWHAIKTKLRLRGYRLHKNLLDNSIEKYGAELVNDIRTLLRLTLLFVPFPIIWSLFDQLGSRWVFQSEKLNGAIGSFTILPEQMQVVNPLLVLILIPLFEALVYPLLRRIGFEGRPLQRITIGGFFVAAAFVLSAILENQIENSPPKSVHILWQLPQFMVLTTGEIMFSPTSTGFAYEQAPERLRSIVQALLLLTSTVGDGITVILSGKLLAGYNQVQEYIIYSIMLFINMVIFAIIAYYYKDKNETKTNTKNRKTTGTH